MNKPTGTALTDLSIQERAAVLQRVRRFAFGVQQLGRKGLADAAPVLVQPAVLVALGNLAQHANAYLLAGSTFEQLQHLTRIERSLRECDELQTAADIQQRDAGGEHSE